MYYIVNISRKCERNHKRLRRLAEFSASVGREFPRSRINEEIPLKQAEILPFRLAATLESPGLNSLSWAHPPLVRKTLISEQPSLQSTAIVMKMNAFRTIHIDV
ncbi:hypothetical protein KQX54_020932 [Cotesia glomerata]|uniref:Uncharacterized protein n=1 Tax=Cotesia glomerata TaxID=32391 RepID=A0AAV7I1L8_COTGL|nr:hypothetical protein KQX54_020932 [Cotesia glomerata]